MNISVILSGGVGTRFGADKPKQYCELNGKDIISYPIETLKNSELTEKIIISANSEYISYLENKYSVDIIKGGNTHNESVGNAVEYISENYNCEKICFLDSVRPFVKSEIIDKYFSLLDEYDGVITAGKITDSLGKYGVNFENRENYYLIQKPEAFNFDILQKHFDRNSETTAICQQMPCENKIYKCFDMKQNLKITYPEDIKSAEFIARFNI
jgi:2-C-methyl-D-erythritol 4-phosphate cytidylyltransferase